MFVEVGALSASVIIFSSSRRECAIIQLTYVCLLAKSSRVKSPSAEVIEV